MQKILIMLFIVLSPGFVHARSDVVLRTITPDVLTLSPGRKQLHTLGWPNDIIHSVAVRTSEGIVLIDTQNSPANARMIRDAALEALNDSTFACIINTHGHSCHSGGNCVFTQYPIIAHKNSLAEIKDYDDLFLGQTVDFLRQKIYHKTNILDTITVEGQLSDSIKQAIDLYTFYERDLLDNYKVRYPDRTFDDSLTLKIGGKTFELTYMGKGHGNADIAVMIPEEGVLCTGNLFHLGSYSEEGMPSFYLNRENEIEHWIASLNTILSKRATIDKVITTHGKKPLTRRNIEFVKAYCEEVLLRVSEAKKDGVAMEKIQELEPFMNVFRSYADVVSTHKKTETMHARNIQIIWKFIGKE
ncbi:MAG TPA: MBL fold metallo-hydrolase [Prolixibacteraceae bacterium]|nr:MBL fold metallo-hydrolase [Prolixibacteraceae bacterium]